MGLRTTYYEVKGRQKILPEAYAVIRETKTRGNSGYAIFAVDETRERAQDLSITPAETVRVDFIVDRNVNDRETAYHKAKSQIEVEEYDHETGEPKKVIKPMPFFGWLDDYV